MFRVAVYGATNIDIHAVCFRKYLPADSNPGHSYISPGGVGRNIAENCARLGLEVDLVTVVGDDGLSSVVVDGCGALGIGLGHSLFLKDTATPRYVCIVNSDGRLVGAVAAMEALDSFTVAEFARRTEAGDKADLIVIDANLPAPVIAAACERWRGRPLFFDPVSAAKAGKAEENLGCFSMVKPNLREALLLSGLERASGGQPSASQYDAAKKSAEILHGRGIAEVFVSLGAEGLFYLSASGCGAVKPLDLPLVNVSGAGDAASAGIIWACSLNLGTEGKARCAVAAASLCASSADAVSKEMSAGYLEELAGKVC